MKKTFLLLALTIVSATCFAQTKESSSQTVDDIVASTKIPFTDTFNFQKLFSLARSQKKVQYQGMYVTAHKDKDNPNFDYLSIAASKPSEYYVAIYRDWTFEPAFATTHDQLTNDDFKMVSLFCVTLRKYPKL